jgi:hypothetical protein
MPLYRESFMIRCRSGIRAALSAALTRHAAVCEALSSRLLTGAPRASATTQAARPEHAQPNAEDFFEISQVRARPAAPVEAVRWSRSPELARITDRVLPSKAWLGIAAIILTVTPTGGTTMSSFELTPPSEPATAAAQDLPRAEAENAQPELTSSLGASLARARARSGGSQAAPTRTRERAFPTHQDH